MSVCGNGNQNAKNEYNKFVQSSLHTEMKSIFDTYIPYILFKECLYKKEQEELSKIKSNEEKTKKEGEIDENNKEEEAKKTKGKEASKQLEALPDLTKKDEEKHRISDDPFDMVKDYDKILNFNLITNEEKDEFRKGKPLPYLQNKLNNILTKKIQYLAPAPLPRQEYFKFQLVSFEYKDISRQKDPKVKFAENISLFNKNSSMNNSFMRGNEGKVRKKYDYRPSENSYISESSINIPPLNVLDKNNNNNNNADSQNDDEPYKVADKRSGRYRVSDASSGRFISGADNFSNNSNQCKNEFHFKTENGKNRKFLQFNKDYLSFGNSKEDNYYNETIANTLSKYSLANNDLPKINDKKIAIPSDKLRTEIFIFDPIQIDVNRGNLNTYVYDEVLKKRARLLYPYRQESLKKIIAKLLQFLFIIKSKINNKKNLKASIQMSNPKKKNCKAKLKEIEGSNIITFGDVKQFMNSNFGHFDINNFIKEFKKNEKENEKKKKIRGINELKQKIKDYLEADDEEHANDEDNNEIDDSFKNPKPSNRGRNAANPHELTKDSKMLRGAVYKPRKKMNYLNGLKMLIKEEASKNKNSNFKYQ